MLALAKQGTSGTKFIEVDCPVHPYDQGKKGDSVGTVTMRVHARHGGIVSVEDAGYVRAPAGGDGEVIMLNPPAPAVEVEALNALSEENAKLRAALSEKEGTLASLVQMNETIAADLEAVKAEVEALKAKALEQIEGAAKTEAPPPVDGGGSGEATKHSDAPPVEREPQVIAPEDEEVLSPPPAGEAPPDPFAS